MKAVQLLLFTGLLCFNVSVSAESETGQAQLIKQGATTYKSYCASCHGDNAEGASKAGRDISIITDSGGNQPPDLTDEISIYGNQQDSLFRVIKEGIPGTMMPGWKGRIPDDQISNIVMYLQALSSGVPQATINAMLEGNGEVTNPEQSPYRLVLSDYVSMPVTGNLNSESNTLAQISRMNFIREEPETGRWFIPDLNGPVFILQNKNASPVEYLNFKKIFPAFHDSFGFASGLINIQFDPAYTQNGKFYTIHLEKKHEGSSQPVNGGFTGLNLENYKHTKTIKTPSFEHENEFYGVLVAWKDTDITNNSFEGTAREILRMDMNRHIHPMGALSFNPYSKPGEYDWRVLYVGVGETGSGGFQDKRKLNAQRLNNFAGTILRIIPDIADDSNQSFMSENGQYRIPDDNPFIDIPKARPEIWAYGLRNPHRLIWFKDKVGASHLIAFNIGQVNWEMINIIHRGNNYGYPIYEGTQLMMPEAVIRKGDAVQLPMLVDDDHHSQTIAPAFPVLQYPHMPVIGGDAISGGYVYQGERHPELKNKLIFGDMTTGNIWYSDMDELLAADDNDTNNLANKYSLASDLKMLTEQTYKKRGGTQLPLPGQGVVSGKGRIDLRFGQDSSGEIFIMTKSDGMIRQISEIKTTVKNP